MLSKVMQAAHRLAKMFEGNYQARMSLALKLAWATINKASGKSNKVNSIKEWFIQKEFSVYDSYFVKGNAIVFAVVKETKKAYFLTALSQYGFKDFWVPKSVCV